MWNILSNTKESEFKWYLYLFTHRWYKLKHYWNCIHYQIVGS